MALPLLPLLELAVELWPLAAPEILPEQVVLPTVQFSVVPAQARFAPALQLVAPAPDPQVQVQGPVPETEEAVPVLQRFKVGALLRVVPLAAPQMPPWRAWHVTEGMG